MTLQEASRYGEISVTAYNAMMRSGITTLGALADAVHTKEMVRRVINWKLQPLLTALEIKICEDHLELPQTDIEVTLAEGER